MGSSLKLGKWIGIGFVIMAVIFIGMAVMRGFDSFIAEDGDKLELVNNHELNNGLSPYKGAIKGTRVRQLFNYLAKNAKDNKNHEELPDIAYQIYSGEKFQIIESTVKLNNSDLISKTSSKFDSTITYTVEFKYSKKGIVNGVIVKVDKKDFDFEPNET